MRGIVLRCISWPFAWVTGHDETHANLGVVVLIRIGIDGMYSNTTIGSGIPFRDTTLGLFPFLGHRRQEGSNRSGFDS